MKATILKSLRACGALAAFRLANRHRVLILNYHRFAWHDDGPGTPARAFAQQLEYLRAHYHLAPLSFLADRLTRGLPVPPRTAIITIDDGYRDAYEVAFPLLRRYGAPATLFVVTGFLDGRAWVWTDKPRYLLLNAAGPSAEVALGERRLTLDLGTRAARLDAAEQVNTLLKGLPDEEKDEAIARLGAALGVRLPAAPPREFGPLTWDEARAMSAAGVEIGSHTVTHPILTRVNSRRLRQEMEESRARLENATGPGADLFCYPNGDYDREVRDAAARAGYRCAVTTEAGLNGRGSDPLALRRVHTERDLTRFIQATSGFEEVKNSLRRARGPRATGRSPLRPLRSIKGGI